LPKIQLKVFSFFDRVQSICFSAKVNLDHQIAFGNDIANPIHKKVLKKFPIPHMGS